MNNGECGKGGTGIYSKPTLVRSGKTSWKKWPFTVLARHVKGKGHFKERDSMCKSIQVSEPGTI